MESHPVLGPVPHSRRAPIVYRPSLDKTTQLIRELFVFWFFAYSLNPGPLRPDRPNRGLPVSRSAEPPGILPLVRPLRASTASGAWTYPTREIRQLPYGWEHRTRAQGSLRRTAPEGLGSRLGGIAFDSLGRGEHNLGFPARLQEPVEVFP